MKTLFYDISMCAKHRGFTEATVRGLVQSGEIEAYIFVCTTFQGTQSDGEFLPAHDHHRFPDVRWEDRGSPVCADGRYFHGTNRYRMPNEEVRPSSPSYFVNGWVRISQETAAMILTRGELTLNDRWVAIDSADGDTFLVYCLPDYVLNDQVIIKIDQSSLMFKPVHIPRDTEATQSKSLDGRREKSLLRIIRALDVMAGLPKRGAATAIEAQVRQLGFDGPNDDTIRGIIEEARAMAMDAPPKT